MRTCVIRATRDSATGGTGVGHVAGTACGRFPSAPWTRRGRPPGRTPERPFPLSRAGLPQTLPFRCAASSRRAPAGNTGSGSLCPRKGPRRMGPVAAQGLRCPRPPTPGCRLPTGSCLQREPLAGASRQGGSGQLGGGTGLGPRCSSLHPRRALLNAGCHEWFYFRVSILNPWMVAQPAKLGQEPRSLPHYQPPVMAVKSPGVTRTWLNWVPCTQGLTTRSEDTGACEASLVPFRVVWHPQDALWSLPRCSEPHPPARPNMVPPTRSPGGKLLW